MSSISVGKPTARSERVLFGKLWWVGPLTIVGALAANLILAAIFQAVLRPDPAFLPLTYGAVGFFTVIGMLGAVAAYTLVGRFSRRPVSLYRRVALVALAISCLPDLLLPFQPAAFPGVTWSNALALIVFHVIGWAIAVQTLTKLAGEE